jgi:NAD(P)-dependent dehydrogenase (short-subunit alcohol dehydrogenase family)
MHVGAVLQLVLCGVSMAPTGATRVAIVTGATKGIGLGIARGLAEQKYRVHITGRTRTGPGSLEAAAAAVRAAGGECVTHVVDHAAPAEISSLFDRVFDAEPDGVDLLVNNVYPAVDALADSLRSGAAKFWELPPTAFAATNDVGLTAHYTATALYAKRMLPRRRPGLVVMVSSPGGLFYFFTAAYSTGKAALDRLTADLAHELRGTQINCVGLYPGLVATEKFQAMAEEGLWNLSPEKLDAEAETPLYSGRAVAALASDVFGSSERADEMSGTIQWTAELAVQYGIRDEQDRQPLSARTLRRVTGIPFLPASWVVPWFILRFLSPRYPAVAAAKNDEL